MPVKRILAGLLLVVLSACSGRGCAVGETVTLIYADIATIAVRSQIVLGQESIGYVDSVETTNEGQRIVMRLREAALLHEDDAFLPLEELDGKIGLSVQSGTGAPLKDGAVIYYPRPIEVAPRPELARSEPLDYTPVVAAPEAPPEDDAPGTVVTFKEDTYARRSIRRAIAEVLEQAEWPEPVRQKADEVYDMARRPGNEMAVLAKVRQNLPALHAALADVAQQAYHKGDEVRARQALKAIQRVVVLENRVGAIQERGGLPAMPAPGGEP